MPGVVAVLTGTDYIADELEPMTYSPAVAGRPIGDRRPSTGQVCERDAPKSGEFR